MSNIATEVVTCLFDSSTGLFLSPSGRFDAPFEARAFYNDSEFTETVRRSNLQRGMNTVLEVAGDVEAYRGCLIARPVTNIVVDSIPVIDPGFVVYIPLSVMGPAGRPTNMCFNIGPTVVDAKRNLDSYHQRSWIK